MPEQESWSWSKFFKGFVDGRNFAKALVMMFCMGIILTICFSVYTVVKAKFFKPLPTVGTNSGSIVNNDKHGNSFSLFNLFNWR